MSNLSEIFMNMCETNSNKSFNFVVNNDECWDFLSNILPKYKKMILNRNGKIHITPNFKDFKDLEEIICGVAPMWKEYESKKQFEEFYCQSEMLRIIYANEFENGELVPIYVDIAGDKHIVTWEVLGNENVFKYREATLEERGTLDILWNIFGGIIDDDGNKVLNQHIGFGFKEPLPPEVLLSICNHTTNLGYSIENIITKKN